MQNTVNIGLNTGKENETVPLQTVHKNVLRDLPVLGTGENPFDLPPPTVDSFVVSDVPDIIGCRLDEGRDLNISEVCSGRQWKPKAN